MTFASAGEAVKRCWAGLRAGSTQSVQRGRECGLEAACAHRRRERAASRPPGYHGKRASGLEAALTDVRAASGLEAASTFHF